MTDEEIKERGVRLLPILIIHADDHFIVAKRRDVAHILQTSDTDIINSKVYLRYQSTSSGLYVPNVAGESTLMKNKEVPAMLFASEYSIVSYYRCWKK